MVKNTENVISLYSGGGGLDIGFRLAIPNARTVCYVEREISSIAVLVNGIEKGILDDAPIWSDSSTFDGNPWVGKVDWIIGGFPCQPWSVAGKREGKEDERWLWDDIKQIGLSVRPKGFFLENVSGLITGHGIDTILGDLSEMGFDAQWGSVKAADVGASHRRERVFILAARRGTDCRFDDILGNTKNIRCEQPKKTDRRRECEPLNRNEIRNIPRTTGNAELDDTKHNGLNATEKQRVNEQTISGSQEGESSTIQSEGTDNTSVTQQGLENSNDTRFHRTQSDGTEREREKEPEERKNRLLSRTRGSSEDNELGDTSSKRSQGIGQQRVNDKKRWQDQERHNRSSKQNTLGLFPPAPNSEEWESILREHPRLSPALEKSSFEPDVRGMVNGMAPGLHRADRLRILGNGVVPIQAAYALTVLARRLND